MMRFPKIESARSWFRTLRNPRLALAAAAIAVGLIVVIVVQFSGNGEPEPVGGPPQLRRLTEAQYRNSIADIFGPDVPISARFERPIRAEGLISIGTSQAGMSPFAAEQYDSAAQSVVGTVLGPERRNEFLHCAPADATNFDADCARSFLSAQGRMLFRRPLAEEEADRFVALSGRAAAQLGDFYEGVKLGLYAMLVSPEFLFRVEQVDADSPSQLDAYSRATRLSFFLTDSTPDDELLRAAESGELDTHSGVSRQVDRLLQSPRLERAIRSFFADMMQFERFDELSKDPEIYPAFNSDVARDAQEQTLRTIVEHLLENNGDYRDLFTTRDTFLTRSLGVIYRTPVPTRGDWEPVRFTEDSHRAGIQSHVSFQALHAHPGRSSPTLRGYHLRQIFLCQEVPDPPANVNFSAVEENAHTTNITARDRLRLHSTEPSCSGCHRVMDPVGLTMENFDGIGAYRVLENGAQIDASGSLDGSAFDTPDGLAHALHDHPETPRCVAERMYTSSVGRRIEWGERYYLDWLIEEFADGGYRIPDLMRRIATSENFFAATPAPDAQGEQQVVQMMGADRQGANR